MPLALTPAPRPSLALFTSEPVRAAADLLDDLVRPSPPSPRSRDGHTVVLFPGLGTNGLSLWTLRQHLSRLGYRAIDWGEGFNAGPTGDIDAWLRSMKEAVLARADAGAAAPSPAGPRRCCRLAGVPTRPARFQPSPRREGHRGQRQPPGHGLEPRCAARGGERTRAAGAGRADVLRVPTWTR